MADDAVINVQDLPAPNEHAFVLRRYDTGAISVTTMFKAAFPGATEEEEEREMRWVGLLSRPSSRLNRKRVS
jgi:hypothetical protein